MKYGVVLRTSFDGLISEVNEFIQQGWKPQGGICVTSTVFHNQWETEIIEIVYSQAIVLEEP